MPQFVRLGSRSELPPVGEAREYEVEGRTICIANADGSCSAMDNVCVHHGGPLGQGVVDGNKIICPWHGWSFDVNTGAEGHNPAARVPVYPLKIEGDDVFVALDEETTAS
jgi:nitrite reductase (NADH) small subunit